MPRVTIHTGAGASLEKAYQSIQADLDARYHAPGNAFTHFHVSDQEAAELASLVSGGNHGCVQIDDTHVRMPNGEVVHIERAVR